MPSCSCQKHRLRSGAAVCLSLLLTSGRVPATALLLPTRPKVQAPSCASVGLHTLRRWPG